MPTFAPDGAQYWIWLCCLAVGFLGLATGTLTAFLPRLQRFAIIPLLCLVVVGTVAALDVSLATSWLEQRLEGTSLFLARLGVMVVGTLGACAAIRGRLQARAIVCFFCSLVAIAGLLVGLEPAPSELAERPPRPRLVVDSRYAFRTDAGTSIQGYRPVEAAAADHVDELLDSLHHGGVVFQVQAPDPASNCFGWVFTGGQVHLTDESVERILHDNRYQPVEHPEPADLIVYRDDSQSITHLGIVKAIGIRDFVLVESKWGFRGVYLHEPRVGEFFGEHHAYYRSHRLGHLLDGCPSDPLETQESAEPHVSSLHQFGPH
jgi:hypothetical protein